MPLHATPSFYSRNMCPRAYTRHRPITRAHAPSACRIATSSLSDVSTRHPCDVSPSDISIH